MREGPSRGTHEGEVSESRTPRYPYLVYCRSCGWTTEPARLKVVALKLWNEAKLAAGAKRGSARETVIWYCSALIAPMTEFSAQP